MRTTYGNLVWRRYYKAMDILDDKMSKRKKVSYLLERLWFVIEQIENRAQDGLTITESQLYHKLVKNGFKLPAEKSDGLRAIRKAIETARKEYGFPIIAYSGKDRPGDSEYAGYTVPATRVEATDYVLRLKAEIEATIKSREATYDVLRSSLEVNAPDIVK